MNRDLALPVATHGDPAGNFRDGIIRHTYPSCCGGELRIAESDHMRADSLGELARTRDGLRVVARNNRGNTVPAATESYSQGSCQSSGADDRRIDGPVALGGCHEMVRDVDSRQNVNLSLHA